ncbi:MAG: hypothetical protein Q9165_000849 [Trypethelium subeluteriae]
MRQYIITPWREKSELLCVRRQLYQLEDSVAVNQRRDAVNLVGAWKIRGNLPHAVESTALLVDAILHHDISKNSIFSIRAVYSAAFCRFVTGFCDSSSRGINLSMYSVAREIDMPASFVELRHEATHEELPSLGRLERNAKAGLDWLWNFYWKKLDESYFRPSPHSTTQSDEVDADTTPKDRTHLKARLQDTFKTYLANRRTEIKSGAANSVTTSVKIRQSRETCIQLCHGDKAKLSILCSTLIDHKTIFPSQKQTTNTPIPMTGAFTIWDPLLLDLASKLPRSFLPTLLTSLLDQLTPSATSGSGLDSDSSHDASHAWILHILTSGAWADVRRRRRDAEELQILVMRACLLGPGHWTRRVAQGVIEEGDEEVRRTWEPLFTESLPVGGEGESVEEGESGGMISGLRGRSIEADSMEVEVEIGMESRLLSLTGPGVDLSEDESNEAREEEEQKVRGWKKWEGPWKSKPIGTL